VSEVDWTERFEECVENGYHEWEAIVTSPSPRAVVLDAYLVCKHCRARANTSYSFMMTKYKFGS